MTDKTQETQDGKAGTAEADSLSVTDNRTGQSYDIEIIDGTVRAMDFRQIKVSDDDFGLMTYDPGFSNTASCRSAVTYIDGENGVLEHRGIAIEQLYENSTYLEMAYLVLYGHLPDEQEYDDWVYQITHHTYVHENIKEFINGFRHDADPMGMLLASVGALSTFYPEAKDVNDEYQRHVSAVRLIAKMPTLAAFAYRHSMGLP
ncbi:MAG: citrate (Si)-synthase, partial [Actinobacteria bacterium]|nr:citrate (Si)-synthase [Actinomycetota bacterium]